MASPRQLAPAPLLDELLGDLLPVVEPQLGDDRFHPLADLDAGGNLGLLVQDPVDRHAQVALAADDVVAAQLVVLADLLGADEQALGEPLLSQADVAAWRDSADLELMANRAGPADGDPSW